MTLPLVCCFLYVVYPQGLMRQDPAPTDPTKTGGSVKYPGKSKGMAIGLWFLGFCGYLNLHAFYLRHIKLGLFRFAIFLVSTNLLSKSKDPSSFEHGLCSTIVVGLFFWSVFDLIRLIRLPKGEFGNSARPELAMKTAATREVPVKNAPVSDRAMKQSMDGGCCLDCGQPAVKQEDFAVYEYRWELGIQKDCRFIGASRVAFCRACIEKRHKESIQSEPGAFKVAVSSLLAACFGPVFFGFFTTMRDVVQGGKIIATRQKKAFASASVKQIGKSPGSAGVTVEV